MGLHHQTHYFKIYSNICYPLPWFKKSDNSYDEHEHREELVTEGMKIPKEKNSRSKEEVFNSAPELEVGREYSEEGVTKEIPGLPTSKTSGQCKRIDEEDAKYIVPKMDITYSLREEEDKENVSNVMPSSGTICKSKRIKKSTIS